MVFTETTRQHFQYLTPPVLGLKIKFFLEKRNGKRKSVKKKSENGWKKTRSIWHKMTQKEKRKRRGRSPRDENQVRKPDSNGPLLEAQLTVSNILLTFTYEIYLNKHIN